MTELTCTHGWNTASGLRLVVEQTPMELMCANIFPMPPSTQPVDYCRLCGALRLRADKLAALRALEEERDEAL